MNHASSYRGWMPAIVACALSGLFVGCGGGPEMPRTYAVLGKVTYKGGEPVSGGSVLFQSEADTTVTTSGEIQPDGTFVLRTIKGKGRAEGAVAGPHRVIVALPSPDQSAESVYLPKPCTVEARDNHFNLVIEKPRR